MDPIQRQGFVSMVALRHRFGFWPVHTLLCTVVFLLALPTGLGAAELLVSTSPDRSTPVPVASQPVQGVVYVFVADADDLDQVRFYLDGKLVKTEDNVPWDLAGTAPDKQALPFDTRDLLDGTYALRAQLNKGGTTLQNLEVGLQVANQPPPEEGADAQQLHMGWEGDPATSLSIMWFTPDTATPASVSYRLAGDSAWTVASGELRHQTADGRYLMATLSGLLADTSYEFRVALAENVWSKVYEGRTAPSSGPHDFDAVFVADTGLVGRSDGLATGTAEVIAEIADRAPRLVLLGGDYVYFDTDKRFGTLERSIAAWFDQMAAVAGKTPMMPVYGNHEVVLGEGFDTWVNYFPTPEGWNNRRMYSFDVGDAHFVAVFGVDEFHTLPQDALDWLAADLADASNRGQRWLIPYFHAAPFSEGTNHPSALGLRGQLGPIFEAAGVQLVLTAHDQSYERTYPLTDVPANNTPTSTARHCYTLGDGVSWLKVAPGGKLSNISKGFSPWKSPTPPPWTVVRNNTLHHYAHLKISADGVLEVDIHGIAGTGAPPVRLDRVRYTTQGCGPELTVQPLALSFNVDPGEVASQTLDVAAGNSNVPFVVTQVPDWLTLSQSSAVTPASLEVTVDATGLAVGKYQGVLELSDGLDNATWLPVSLMVGASSYSLWVADNPQRLAAEPLEGTVLQGNRYVFTSPDTDVERVRFYLNDPSGTGSVTQTENHAPFDLAGTAPDGSAYPLNTATLADGSHALGARLDLVSGGQLLLDAGFQVANDVPQLAVTPSSLDLHVSSPQTTATDNVLAQMTDGQVVAYTSQSSAAWLTVAPAQGTVPETLAVTADTSGLNPGQYQGHVTLQVESGEQAEVAVNLTFDQPVTHTLQVSTAPDRSAAIPLQGANLSGNVYVFVPEVSGTQKVTFYLDDPNRERKAIKVENNAPWDFAGTILTPPYNAYPFDLTGLSSGPHQITAVVDDGAGGIVVHGGFDVSP